MLRTLLLCVAVTALLPTAMADWTHVGGTPDRHPYTCDPLNSPSWKPPGLKNLIDLKQTMHLAPAGPSWVAPEKEGDPPVVTWSGGDLTDWTRWDPVSNETTTIPGGFFMNAALVDVDADGGNELVRVPLRGEAEIWSPDLTSRKAMSRYAPLSTPTGADDWGIATVVVAQDIVDRAGNEILVGDESGLVLYGGDGAVLAILNTSVPVSQMGHLERLDEQTFVYVPQGWRQRLDSDRPAELFLAKYVIEPITEDHYRIQEEWSLALGHAEVPVDPMAVVDLDQDGWKEIVLPLSYPLHTRRGFGPGFIVASLDGRVVAYAPEKGSLLNLAVGDLDGDGRPEIVAPYGDGNVNGDSLTPFLEEGTTEIRAYEWSPGEGFMLSALIKAQDTSPLVTAVCDLDGDGDDEVIAVTAYHDLETDGGGNDSNEGWGCLYIWDGDGEVLFKHKFYHGTPVGLAVDDLDLDGNYEILVSTFVPQGYVFDPDVQQTEEERYEREWATLFDYRKLNNTRWESYRALQFGPEARQPDVPVLDDGIQLQGPTVNESWEATPARKTNSRDSATLSPLGPIPGVLMLAYLFRRRCH